ncbi:MAG: type II toxin-antitoxin system VapC family toxin [Thermodesulfobacteriota bacterium]
MSKRIFSFKDTPPKVAYIDPSFFVNYLVVDGRYHKECVSYSGKLEAHETILLLSNLGVDEIWFAILRVLSEKYLIENKIKANWFRYLSENPDIIRSFSKQIEEDTFAILEIPRLAVIEISKDQTLNSLSAMKKYGLFPRDAIHATAAKLSGAGAIITTDIDFIRVNNIEIYTCNPKAF